jgi:hypothetical protein
MRHQPFGQCAGNAKQSIPAFHTNQINITQSQETFGLPIKYVYFC